MQDATQRQESLKMQFQKSDCPRCHGSGEYLMQGNAHESEGIVPCDHWFPDDHSDVVKQRGRSSKSSMRARIVKTILPAEFTLKITENETLGWVITSDAHKGFLCIATFEEGLVEGLREAMTCLRQIIVAQMDLDLGRERAGTYPWSRSSDTDETHTGEGNDTR
jgi:hypothetical protein